MGVLPNILHVHPATPQPSNRQKWSVMRTGAGKLFSTQVKEPPGHVVIVKYITFTSSSAPGNAQSPQEHQHAAAICSSTWLSHCRDQGEVRRSYRGGRSRQEDPGCWQWGDNGCPARFALSGQGHPRECCPPGGTRNEEPGASCSASPSHASVCRMLVAALMFCSGRAQQRLPDIFSFTAAICAQKGHISPQQKAVPWPVTVAESTLAAAVTSHFHRPESAVENKIQKQQMRACVSTSRTPAGAHRAPDTLETSCTALLVSL